MKSIVGSIFQSTIYCLYLIWFKIKNISKKIIKNILVFYIITNYVPVFKDSLNDFSIFWLWAIFLIRKSFKSSSVIKNPSCIDDKCLFKLQKNIKSLKKETDNFNIFYSILFKYPLSHFGHLYGFIVCL